MGDGADYLIEQNLDSWCEWCGARLGFEGHDQDCQWGKFEKLKPEVQDPLGLSKENE